LTDDQKIFALDIGTRSVVGIIMKKINGKFHVMDVLSKEHPERSMMDGQIHDVLSVSNVITEIKAILEKKHGPLHKVCVAAAGRSLKTEQASATANINGQPMMSKEDILHLELSAVQAAQAKVAENQGTDISHYYYCVGYSVLDYRLDDEKIGSLIDQQGGVAEVKIIATFLPRVVVESLIAALTRSGLEMDALTLEPIAAINVLIPPSMRRLNIALVDIGAGTSDIAISNLGTVIAYGMVPIAGDEITEAMSDQYLLDFPLAEQAKKELATNETITITDILGFQTEIPRAEAISQLSPAVDQLANAICNEILRLNNNRSPKAVMLVGGGSLTPELPERIAAALKLPKNRVAIRGIDAISSLTLAEDIESGPELVTPIGIAIAAKNTPIQYITVYVNEQPIRLFEINTLTVGDSLLAAGIKMNKLYGKPGMAKMVTLNEKIITIPGKLGNRPIIQKNGRDCPLDEPIQNDDQIFVKKGTDGEPAELQIKDLIDHLSPLKVTVNQMDYQVAPEIICNGVSATAEKWVDDRDEIHVRIPKTIAELLVSIKRKDLLLETESFQLTINDKLVKIPGLNGKVTLNGREAGRNSNIGQHDSIVIDKRGELTVEELADLQQKKLFVQIPVFFNGKEIILTKTAMEVIKDGRKLTAEDVLQSGDQITLTEKETGPFIFQDLFGQVEIKMPTNANGQYVLLKNNNPATFYEPIAPGDDLKIVWPLSQEIY